MITADIDTGAQTSKVVITIDIKIGCICTVGSSKAYGGDSGALYPQSAMAGSDSCSRYRTFRECLPPIGSEHRVLRGRKL